MSSSGGRLASASTVTHQHTEKCLRLINYCDTVGSKCELSIADNGRTVLCNLK